MGEFKTNCTVVALCMMMTIGGISSSQATGVRWSDTPIPGYHYEWGIGYYSIIPNDPGQAANITYLDHYVDGAQFDRYVGFFLIGQTPPSDASEVLWSDDYKPGYTYEENVGFYKVISATEARERRNRRK